ncbi:MAG: hypothetical protein K6L76_10195 [Agarilytica sp.]
MNLNTSPISKKQRGSALVISLIILLVMSILGIQGMQGTALEERMSGNFRDRTLAFEAAEAALLAGEAWLNQQTEVPVANDTGSNVVWNFGVPNITGDDFWSNVTVPIDVDLNDDDFDLSQNPQYVIEERAVVEGSGGGTNSKLNISQHVVPSSSGVTYSYRITARGYGSSPNSVVILQANYNKVF